MPQRTNDFQRLVFAIYKNLVGTTAIVKESVLIPEINDPKEISEVDILIEHTVAGSKIRLGVEIENSEIGGRGLKHQKSPRR